MHISIYMRCVSVFICVCACVCACVSVCVCVYIHAYAHVHTQNTRVQLPYKHIDTRIEPGAPGPAALLEQSLTLSVSVFRTNPETPEPLN